MAKEPIGTLGPLLMSARGIKGLSVRRAAELAKIAPTYLQKLEGGQVQAPSPHILNRLSRVLEISYAGVMRAAGYIVPKATKGKASGMNVLAGALKSVDLSEQETRQMLEYLAFLRMRKKLK